MDYKSVFTNLCLELQQNMSWIKDWTKIHKRVNSFTDNSAFCQGAPKRVPSDSAKHRRLYTSSNVCHSHEWRVDTASGKTLKKRNVCLHAVRQAVEKKIACIHGLRSEGVKATFQNLHSGNRYPYTLTYDSDIEATHCSVACSIRCITCHQCVTNFENVP